MIDRPTRRAKGGCNPLEWYILVREEAHEAPHAKGCIHKMTTEHKLPKITTEIDHAVTVGELPEIKAWIAETKPHLVEYAKLLIDRAEERESITWRSIFEIEATFYNDNELPVLRIAGKAIDRASATGRAVIFVEVFADETAIAAVRYARVEENKDRKD